MQAITTERCQAIGRACIGINRIAIITAFAILDCAIAATGWSAIRTRIFRVVVAIIAAFRGTQNTIPTTFDCAAIRATVRVVSIPVVAFLVTCFTRRSVVANNSIAAAGGNTL
tara:strand:+ start:408 stop:746 length:339 start_codon:yes stop_codon:yes gene_type:complete